jgi:hypothetical protein
MPDQHTLKTSEANRAIGSLCKSYLYSQTSNEANNEICKFKHVSTCTQRSEETKEPNWTDYALHNVTYTYLEKRKKTSSSSLLSSKIDPLCVAQLGQHRPSCPHCQHQCINTLRRCRNYVTRYGEMGMSFQNRNVTPQKFGNREM